MKPVTTTPSPDANELRKISELPTEPARRYDSNAYSLQIERSEVIRV